MAKAGGAGLVPPTNEDFEEADSFVPCFRCGICCTKYRVRLNLIDAKRIADGLGLGWDSFAEKYLEPYYPGAKTFLITRQDGACIFLKQQETEEGLTTCLVHSFKPSACQEWTPSLYRPECRQGLAKHWGLTVDGSGRLRGPKELIEAFRSFLSSINDR